MNDEELLELCKEVYKRTGWDDKSSNKRFIAREITTDAELGGNTASYYTSDYLLEKLRRSVSLNFQPKVEEWWANDTSTHVHSQSSTPLKALLKLTIALHEAGELK